MFADIVIRASFLVDEVSGESTVRHIFLILAPADSFSFEQIHNSLHRCIDCSGAIRGEPVGATSGNCDVVWLTRVRDGPVVGKGNSLGGNPFKTCCSR